MCLHLPHIVPGVVGSVVVLMLLVSILFLGEGQARVEMQLVRARNFSEPCVKNYQFATSLANAK